MINLKNNNVIINKLNTINKYSNKNITTLFLYSIFLFRLN